MIPDPTRPDVALETYPRVVCTTPIVGLVVLQCPPEIGAWWLIALVAGVFARRWATGGTGG